MSKIRLRGLKLLAKGAQVAAGHPATSGCLAAAICSPLAAQKINLTWLSHVGADETAGCVTAFCTESSKGPASASLLGGRQRPISRVQLQPEVSILSVFPHGQRPEVSGHLLQALAAQGVTLLGLASSPAALSVVLPAGDTDRAVSALFGVFGFPSYGSPAAWHAAYQGQEKMLQQVIASYHEKVIGIYGIVPQPDLDLCCLRVAAASIPRLGAALVELGQKRLRLDFLAAGPGRSKGLLSALGFGGADPGQVSRVFARHLPEVPVEQQHRAGALAIHGPHFGDRYGIASTVVGALEGAGLRLLAMSCAVSTISVILSEDHLLRGRQVLDATFARPSLPRGRRIKNP